MFRYGRKYNIKDFVRNLALYSDGGGGGGDDPPKGGGGYSAEYVRSLRDENAGWRTKLRASEDTNKDLISKLDAANAKIKDLEGQSKSFTDTLCKALGLDASKIDADALASTITSKIKETAEGSGTVSEKAQEALKKSAFIAAATKAGITDPSVLEDAYKLADLSGTKVDLETLSVFPVDKDGKQLTKDDKPITGLDSLVEGLVKEKSYLVGKVNKNVGGPGSPGGDGGGNLTEEEQGKKIAEDRMKARKEQKSGGTDPWATQS